jgi:alpha-L-fucosidase
MTDTTRPTPPPPAPCGPLPSPRQRRWHRLEFYGFLHFTTNTFTDLEWGFGDESPAIFNPTDFDADAMVGIARAAGMQGLILTCKHHDGFCLWPSRYTEHSVKNSPWRGGRGDVVRELSVACARQGLRFGVYLSPWDRNHALYGRPEYVTYYRNQLAELLSDYGPIFEMWHDGANGGDGFYGGARDKRTIDKTTYYGWEKTWQLVRDLQPEAVIFSDVGPDVRWCGNESGSAGETNWCTLNPAGWCPGFAVTSELNRGHEDGTRWLPAEVDVSIRPGWFYHAHEDQKVRTVQNLVDIYYQSVGRGANLLLNLPPDRRGRIHEIDAERLLGLRRTLDTTFATDLARGATVSASSVRGNHPDYAAAHLVDGREDTYWASDDGVTQASLTVELPRPVTFDQVVLQEHIELGQRVQSWVVEVEREGAWTPLCHGATIGHQRWQRFPAVTASRLRLRILQAKACPVLSRLRLCSSQP